jgi:hypothetical protein
MVTTALNASSTQPGTTWAGLHGWAKLRLQAGASRFIGCHARMTEAMGWIQPMRCLRLFFFPFYLNKFQKLFQTLKFERNW